MKHLTIIFALHFSLFTFHSSAALPQNWDVDLEAQPPQVFTLQRPRGEEYDLEAVLKNHGKPFAPAITNAFIYWQTNGMENLYWSAPASVSNNVLRATWLPSMDPGATTVRGYIGDPGHVYAAAFQFRFIASPGALPNALPLPTPVIDFARVTVLNPPWSGGGGSGGTDTNAVRDIVLDTLATNGIPEQIAALQSGKADMATTYTKTETDENIAAHHDDTKRDITDGNFLFSNISCAGSGTFDNDVVGNAISENPDRLSAKRNLTNNVCAADSFGEWVKSSDDFDVYWITGSAAGTGWHFLGLFGQVLVSEDENATELNYESYTATRARLAVSNETFVTHSFVTNFVSSHASPPSPTLRLHDDVLGCWWIIKIVNGVMTREVE